MSNALHICQRRHDDAEPTIPWIETPAGVEWLRSSTASLVYGLDVTVSLKPRIEVKAVDFISEYSQRAQHLLSADFGLEWALARGNAFFGSAAFSKLAQEVAEEMLLPHRDKAEQAMKWLED